MSDDRTRPPEPPLPDITVTGDNTELRGAGFRAALRPTVVGNAVSQVVLVVAGLVVARLYGPALLGTFATYAALTVALVPLATLRYVQAIPLATERSGAAQTLVLCLACSLAIPALGVLLALPAGLFGLMPVPWILTVAIGTTLLSVQQCCLFFLASTDNFGRYASSRVAYAVALLGLQATLVLVSRSAVSLIGAELLASLVAIVWGFHRIGLRDLSQYATRDCMMRTARLHSAFPRYQLLGGMLNSLSLQAPVVLIGGAFGSTAAGLYSLAYRVLYAPIGLISQSVSAVFFPTIAKGPASEMSARVATTSRMLGLLAGAYALALAVAAPLLLTTVLGSRWEDAVEIIWVLSPMVVIYATTSAVSTVLIVRGQQRRLLAIQALLLVTTAVPLSAPFASQLTLLQCLVAYTVLQSLAYSYYFLTVLRCARQAAQSP